MRSGGFPRTKLAEMTSGPDVSISTRTSSWDALYSATSSVMNGIASRLLNVKRMVSAPEAAAQLVRAAPTIARPRAPAVIRNARVRFSDTIVLPIL